MYVKVVSFKKISIFIFLVILFLFGHRNNAMADVFFDEQLLTRDYQARWIMHLPEIGSDSVFEPTDFSEGSYSGVAIWEYVEQFLNRLQEVMRVLSKIVLWVTPDGRKERIDEESEFDLGGELLSDGSGCLDGNKIQTQRYSNDVVITVCPLGSGSKNSNRSASSKDDALIDSAGVGDSGGLLERRKRAGLTLALPDIPTQRDMPPTGLQREMTSDLSVDLGKVRKFLNGSATFFEGCNAERLVLDENVKAVSSIEGQGHRLKLIIEFINGVKYVLKVTDHLFQDFNNRYCGDAALITYSQALLDVDAYLSVRDILKEKYPEVVFPKTRVVLLSIDEFIRIIPKNSNQRKCEMIGILQKSLACKDHSNYYFSVLQEYIDMRPVEAGDFKKLKAPIDYISSLLKDVGDDGQNLNIGVDTNGLVLVDVEKDQVSFCLANLLEEFNFSESDEHQKESESKRLIEAFNKFDELYYLPLPLSVITSIKRSLSSSSSAADSGFSEEGGSTGSYSRDKRGRLVRQGNVVSPNDPNEYDEVFDETSNN